jgi:proton-dependent oligopeptide transporter, POT family
LISDPYRREWFGQPRGLTILFLTDMWGQFSFYGMRALLVYYMTKQLRIEQQHSSMIYGWYTATVFLTPLAGGMLADRWLGRKAAVVLGAAIMACGHFMMAFESLFFPALAFIAIGSGLFIPSLPAQIDGLYAREDPRRRSAYNIYYVGINLGALLAPLVVGSVGESYGWHWGFTVAGVGMGIGLLTYLGGSHYLPGTAGSEADRSVEVVAGVHDRVALSRGALRERIALLLSIAACVVVFRSAYEQLGNTVALWLDSGVDRTVTAQWSVPMTWFMALNPLLVFSLTPLLVSRWTRKAARGREPSSVTKMWIGALWVCGSYLMLAGAAWWASAHGFQTYWLWFLAFFVLMTLGELHILPVGLGLFGRLAPKGLASTAIATWYLAGFFGNLLAGWLGGFWSVIGHAAFFALIGMLALVAGILLLFLVPWSRRVESVA